MTRTSRRLTRALAVLLALVVSQVWADAPEAPDEAALIAVLESNADWAVKEGACRALREVGTARSVPALAALLPDPELSHLARFALEPMPYPEAGQALRDALETTSGLAKTGVIISLGARRDAEAVSLISPLLDDADTDLVRAALGALGRIAAPDAVRALQDFQDRAPGAVRPALAEALLAAGHYLTESGEGDAAAEIFAALLKEDAGWPDYVRMGAWRGRAYAKPDQTSAFVFAALLEGNALFRDLAAQTVAETSGERETKFYAEGLGKLAGVSPESQAALLRGLAGRGDKAARSAVLETLDSPAPEVRLAAINALANLGDTADVPALSALMVSEDETVAAAARGSLLTLQAENLDQALAGHAAQTAGPERAGLLAILSERASPMAVPEARKYLDDESEPVRLTAIDTLGRFGSADEARVILDIFEHSPSDSDRAAAERALNTLVSNRGDVALPALLASFEGARREVGVAILRAFSRIGRSEGLPVVVAELDGGALREEAVRALANWPNLDAAPHLLELARGGGESHTAGLRGYVRLARELAPPEKKAEMLSAAMELAREQREKWAVLSAWGTFVSPQSLDALVPHLDDPDVTKEAAAAIIAVASELGKQDEQRPAALAALGAVIEKCADEGIRQRARQALDALS